MIAPHARRGPYEASGSSYAPNAALLIDFDNVTMAIRSDLGKELKTLLNSDIIKGKVSVQRAYADWRRYPQYIVPLAESSVDLIFAPAYGSSKKNATDLRMAIDAMELVFTRPEIGTFILLTGDSDFSSCVLKLKEYGKYVIGVGMRESASDLLIQNCDEYYSYHAISGLTRAGEVSESKEDPWVLVRRATEQMVANGDVMRTDRLKQVMLSLDPAFDEKKLGYQKFSRFISEASRKGLLQLRKADDGQYEILLGGSETSGEPAAEAAAPPAERGRSRDRRRDRDDGRHRRREPVAEEPRAETAAPAEPAPAPQPELELAATAPEAQDVLAGEATDLKSAYGLLQQALRTLARNGEAVRDGDVKRKMLELSPDFDEGKLGFSKFSRFLRQAHDAEAVDLQRVNGGQYEVSPGSRAFPFQVATRRAPPAEAAAASAPSAPAAEPETPIEPAPVPLPLRARRGRGGRADAAPPPILPGQVIRPTPSVAPPAAEAVTTPSTAAAASAAEPSAPEAVTESPEITPPAPRRGRRGGRRRGAAAEAPPPVLPGQVVPAPTESAAAAPEAAEAEAPAAEEPQKPRRSRPRKRKAEPEQTEIAAVEEPSAPAFSAEGLGLPRDRDSVIAYLSNSYKGIGKKTAETLLDAFGDDMFRVLQEEPDRVREVLDNRRSTSILEQWSADYERRSTAAAEETGEAAEPQAEAPDEPAAASEDLDADDGAKRGRPRGRRGGRGRGGSRKKKAEPASP